MTNRQIELSHTQMDFLQCDERFTAFIGGIGSGKTYAGCVKDLVHARTPGSLGLVVAPTYPMLRDATLRTFIEIAGDAVDNLNKSEMTVKVKGGGEILFRSADNPDRLRGPNLNWAHIDEGAMCPAKTFDVVIGRLRADGQAGPMWITTTPNGRNWLYHRREEMRVFKSRTRDNPYLSPEFVASLERAYTGEFAKQELEGEFISLEGLVYPMFREDVHIKQLPNSMFTHWALALDEGYTNPAVILLIGIDADGRLHVAREFYQTGVLQSRVCAVCSEWANEMHTNAAIVDQAAAGLIADLRNYGMVAEGHKGRVLDGIAIIQDLLKVANDGKPRLTIDPSCVNTINEFESYIWKPGKDEPVKENDHAADALRYFAHWLYGEEIVTRTTIYDPVRIG
jgi:PBSX family phage terminase large subunit